MLTPARASVSAGAGYPQSKMAIGTGWPGFPARPAASSRATRSRTCPAVASVGSSPGASRTASTGYTHEELPQSTPVTREYGQPGIVLRSPSHRQALWQ